MKGIIVRDITMEMKSGCSSGLSIVDINYNSVTLANSNSRAWHLSGWIWGEN